MSESLYRCGLYVRVSTEEQAENPEGSIKNQEQRLREFVKLKNHVAPFGEVAGVYSDPGFSAKDMNRPGFQKLLKAIKRKEINLILVTELSRLTRSMKDFGLLQEFLKKNECEFLSLRENFDTASATGGMVLNIMASIAEFERRQTAERISQSFLARAKRGLYNGGSVPLGYRIDEEKRGGLLIVPEEAQVVRVVFSAFLKRETLAQTAKWLNDQKIELPKRVKGGGSVRAGTFRLETVRKILRNPIYAGIRSYKVKKGPSFVTEQTKAAWEPIIDIDTFERAQNLLTKNRYRKRSHLNLRYPYTLSSVCYCQACGNRMAGKSAHGKAGKIAYYEHSWVTNRNAILNKKLPQCTPFRILAKKIEPSVWKDVKLFLTSEHFISEVLESVKQAAPDTLEEQELHRLTTKCQSLTRQIEVLAERVTLLPEGLDPTVFYSQMERLQKSKQETEALKEEKSSKVTITDHAVSYDSLQAFTESFRALLKRADLDQEIQTAIVRKVVHRIEVTKEGYDISFHLGQNYYEREFSPQMDQNTLSAGKEKGALALTRAPTRPLEKFLSDSSKRLVNGGFDVSTINSSC